MTKPQALPIDTLLEPLNSALESSLQIIIHAPPGAGKSTRLPLWLLSNPRFYQKTIYLIQPRRLAAVNVANFLARQLGQSLGHNVGLRTRYETLISDHTRLVVMTEGVFIRLIQADSELTQVGCVIFDEFHERSVALDLGLALSFEVQQAYREVDEPLQLIIMSATLAVDRLSVCLPEAKLLACEGRCYPVITHYQPVPQRSDMNAALMQLVQSLLNERPQNILIFLPGMHEIRQLERALMQATLAENTVVYALHSALSDEQQKAAIAATVPGENKLVLATNIAETSITIEGIQTVIDSGLAKVACFDPKKGLSQLLTQRISKASADQRQGRAGRTGPGVCYRMWSQATHSSLYDYDRPALQRDDVAPFLLELAQWGVKNLNELILLDKPYDKTIKQASLLLRQLSAIDESNRILAHGKSMVSLGLHPRLASMCIKAKQQQCLAEAALLATLLSEPLSLNSSRQADFLPVIHAVASAVDGLSKNDLSVSGGRRIIKQAKQLYRRLGGEGLKIDFKSIDKTMTDLLLIAYPERVAKQRVKGTNRYLMANGVEVLLHEEDDLSAAAWLLVIHHGSVNKLGQSAYVHQAVTLNEDHIQTLAKRQEKSRSLNWDEKSQAFVAREICSLGAITISTQVVSADEAGLSLAVIDYVSERGLSVLDDADYRQLAARAALHNSCETLQERMPDLDEATLLSNIEQWLAPYLVGVKNKASIKAINLAKIIHSNLTWPQQQALKHSAPEYFVLPTGNKAYIDYCRLHKPVVSVKLQECYGLKETPMLANNIKILFELLSPALRPLQLTDDLAGFWAGSYIDVAKEMRGRYPKHFWPDDPAGAKATTKIKKFL